MIEKLLSEIRSGGTFEVNTLASKLETTPGLVKAMLNHLQILGYIRSYQTCGEACGGCYFRSDCGLPHDANHHNEGSPIYVMMETSVDVAEIQTEASGIGRLHTVPIHSSGYK